MGLSLKGYIERVREVPAQEDYVIQDLLALVCRKEKCICLSNQSLRLVKLYFQHNLEIFMWIRGGLAEHASV